MRCNKKEKYDLICSLGGNCAVAQALRFRNQRIFSLPFDWLFIKDEKPIYYLAEGFRDHFKNFCLKENLVELSRAERGTDHPELCSIRTHIRREHIKNWEIYPDL